ncbi:MAG: hypothetical protein E6J47_06240 [Chloroflexi bacterium]|nr:MAG: hypothetical protein E6J47_06240 [Chloroflexota bacterium]
MRRLLIGATLGVAAIASVWIFLTVDSTSHSVSDTFYGAAVPIGLIWLVAGAVIFTLRRTMASP